MRLTPLETAFVDALLRSPTLDCHAAYLDACRYAGKQPGKDAPGAARALYQRDKVRSELQRRRRYHEQAVDAQTVQLEQMIARCAFVDLRRLYDEHGAMLPPSEWPDDLAAAVAGIEEDETHTVRGKGKDAEAETTTTRKVKIVDRLAAARLLLQRRGLAQDKDHGGGFVARFEINLGG